MRGVGGAAEEGRDRVAVCAQRVWRAQTGPCVLYAPQTGPCVCAWRWAASSWGGKQAPPFFSSDGQACDVWDPDTASCVISFTVSSTSHRRLCYSRPAACQPAAVFNLWNRSDTRALWRLPGRAPKPSRCLFLYLTGQRLLQPQKPYLWKYLPSPAAQILHRVPRHTMHLRRAGFSKSKSCRLDHVVTFFSVFSASSRYLTASLDIWDRQSKRRCTTFQQGRLHASRQTHVVISKGFMSFLHSCDVDVLVLINLTTSL